MIEILVMTGEAEEAVARHGQAFPHKLIGLRSRTRAVSLFFGTVLAAVYAYSLYWNPNEGHFCQSRAWPTVEPAVKDLRRNVRMRVLVFLCEVAGLFKPPDPRESASPA